MYSRLAAMNSGDWSAIGTWFTAAIYIVILFYAVKQVNEAKKLRMSQVRPFVIVDIEPGFVLYLVVQNIGSTLARDVKITFTPDLRSSIEAHLVSETPMLRDGIRNLPPSRKHRIFFDALMHRNKRDDLPESYEVEVRYTDDEKNLYCDLYVLDLRSLYNTSPPEAGLPEVVDAVKDLTNTVGRWTDGRNGLLVHSRDKDDMLRVQRERFQSRLAQISTIEGSGDSDSDRDESDSNGEDVSRSTEDGVGDE